MGVVFVGKCTERVEHLHAEWDLRLLFQHAKMAGLCPKNDNRIFRSRTVPSSKGSPVDVYSFFVIEYSDTHRGFCAAGLKAEGGYLVWWAFPHGAPRSFFESDSLDEIITEMYRIIAEEF